MSRPLQSFQSTVSSYPSRIVCLTEESTEMLYILGVESRIVGISGFTVRPKEAKKEKPVVCTFIDAEIDKIIALKPDLVIGFSDIQANIAKKLIEKGITVLINNHRSLPEIMGVMIQLGAMVNKLNEVNVFMLKIKAKIESLIALKKTARTLPKVYFEEWYDPLITGIKWVSDIIEVAGGEDVFREYSALPLAKDRILSNSAIVVERNPDIIIVSWCGKAFKKDKMIKRKNWDKITAIKENQVFEIKSSIILQPGPAALTAGLDKVAEIISNWQKSENQIKK